MLDYTAGGTDGYYREYTYDQLGNMLDLYHHVGTGNQFHRVFNGYDVSCNPNPYELSNLAEEIEYGGTTIIYTFDDNGNMVTEGSGRQFEWDFGDRMRGFAEGTVNAPYFYDAGGNRLKKVVGKSSSLKEVTVYIDGGFEHLYTLDGTNTVRDETNEVLVMDVRSRVARVTVEAGISDLIKYNLEDHLGNASFTLNEAGSLINREEYFPFGETSFGSYAKKRYRFCGKERDEESGLYYYGARYYACWSCRFVSIDPLAGKMPFATPYSYAANNPVVLVDVDGLAPGGDKDKPGGSASNLAQPAVMKDDHGPTTGSYAAAAESKMAYRDYVTRPDAISVDHVGEAKAKEDAWADGWANMSFGEKWANQDKYYSIKNRQNYDTWVDGGNDPEKFQRVQTPMETWGGGNEAAFYSLGGIKGEIVKGNEKPISRFTGAWSPSPVATRPTFGYQPTLVPIKIEVSPTASRTVASPKAAKTVSASTINDGKALPDINIGGNQAKEVHKNSNDAPSHFGIYVIHVNGVLYKFGKADLTYVVQRTGMAERLNTQIRQLKAAFPNDVIEGKLIEDLGVVTTQYAKTAETQYLQSYYNKNGTVPLGNQKSFTPR